jgi:diguanylate cyclase (GGDEF)-like protein/PAS domain S-box-containing protein
VDPRDILLSLVNHLDAMVAYWDRDQVCVFANEAYRQWFGKAGSELKGTTLKELLGPLYAMNLPYIKAAYEGRVQVFEREIPTPEGRIRYSLATYTPHIVDGKVHGIFVHVADVSPLKVLENELRAAKAEAERLATHDFLTGLPNRVLLVDRITQAFALARRTGRLVAGMSVDLDNFKQVNDAHGHTVGDQLLVEVASRLKNSLRDCDTVTRMGGDEFFLLCPEMDSGDEVEQLAARIQNNVREPFWIGRLGLLPACSVGIAIGRPADERPEALIEASDQALIDAKSLGKDRIEFAGT